jgi:uncharacterized protein
MRGCLLSISRVKSCPVEEHVMAHYFEIKQNKKGEYVAYFKYNQESIFWTEGYSSKASAKNAIASVLKNGPGAEIREVAE